MNATQIGLAICAILVSACATGDTSISGLKLTDNQQPAPSDVNQGMKDVHIVPLSDGTAGHDTKNPGSDLISSDSATPNVTTDVTTDSDVAISAFSAAQMLGCPILVALSGRIGRLTVLRMCLAGNAGASLLTVDGGVAAPGGTRGTAAESRSRPSHLSCSVRGAWGSGRQLCIRVTT